MKNMGKKVYVGLSGGVDSSVSAALLKERGFDVTGVFIKVWQPDWIECTWKEDRLDAMRVAAKLGIPFKTLDLEAEYKQGVIDYMVAEYRAGRTPNPDVMCNKVVKFGAFLEWAKKDGADYVATGHYAQNVDGVLKKGKDENKDQSYFLWTLTQEQLAHILFPVGELEKTEVRKIAKRHGLITADKKDSQGLCFVGDIEMRDFLKHMIDTKEGDVQNRNGDVIGVHEGALLYTIGQRHGFTITEKTPDDTPYFVHTKDVEKNVIVVDQEKPLAKRDAQVLVLGSVNWIAGEAPIGEVLARIRYRGALLPAQVSMEDGRTYIHFKEPVSAVATGQSVVVYKDEFALGGGVIQ